MMCCERLHTHIGVGNKVANKKYSTFNDHVGHVGFYNVSSITHTINVLFR